MDQQARTSTSYLAGVDGLRAVAVLSVILYHLDAALLPGGFTGVDVFFVISGYVISRSLAAGNPTTFPAFLLGFYKRRILRIFPALLVCLGITSTAAVMFIPEAWLSQPNQETALWAFFGASNFFLVSNADGYFSVRIPFNPFMHTWSLAVEEQFYLFFPVIFYVWLRARSRGSRHHGIALAVLPVIAAVSLALAAVETRDAHDHAFYLLPSRFWELAVGAMLFQSQSYRPAFFDAAGRWLMPAGAALLAIAFWVTDEALFPFPWGLLPVTGAMLIIAACTGPAAGASLIGRLLASDSMTYVGRISYSLYLWHWPVFTLFRWTVGLTSLVSWVMALAITFTLSVLSYHLVENSFRRSSFFKQQASWKIVSGGLATIAIAFLTVSQFFQHQHRLGLNLSSTADSCLWSPLYDENCLPDPVTGTTPSRQLFVIGDSHAGAYNTMTHLAADRLGAKLRLHSLSGCPIATLISTGKGKPACRNFERDTLAWIKRNAKPGDIVFLASLRMHRLGDQWGLFDQAEVLARSHTAKQTAIRQQALADTEALVQQLHALGLHVLIDAPKPIFRAPPFRCSDWFNAGNPICTPGFTIERDLLLRHREAVMASLRELRDSYGAYLWDPFPILCPGAVCSAFDGNKPMFSDGDHLSGYGNRLLVDSFSRELAKIWHDGTPLPQDKHSMAGPAGPIRAERGPILN